MNDIDALRGEIAALRRQVADMQRNLATQGAVARSTLAPTDSGAVQKVQLQLDALSVRDDVPILYNFGFSGMPPIGTDFHVSYLDGNRSKAVAIATNHQASRMRGLGLGDSAQYDQRGAYVWLAPGGPSINGAGNPILVTGVLRVTLNVVAGFGGAGSVGLQTHTHTGPGGNTGPPIAGT